MSHLNMRKYIIIKTSIFFLVLVDFFYHIDNLYFKYVIKDHTSIIYIYIYIYK